MSATLELESLIPAPVIDDWFTVPGGSGAGGRFRFILLRPAPKPRTEPRAKPRPRRHSRDETYREDLRHHLIRHVPGFGDQPRKIQHALAYLVWVAGTGRRQHNTFAGYMTISYRELDRLFGRGGFKRVNDTLQMVEVIEPPDDGKTGSTKGYRLTPAVAAVMQEYLQAANIGLTHLVGIDGKRMLKPPRAIASKDSDGHTQTVWNGAHAPNVVPVDLGRLYRLREAWTRESVELEGAGDSTGSAAINGKRYRVDMLNRLLHLAHTHAAGTGRVMMHYVMCSTGRLFAPGVANLQNVPREIRNAALHGLWDYDIENCHFAIFQQMAAKRGCVTNAIANYIANKETIRRGIAERVGITYEKVKECLLATMYGARQSVREGASIPEIIGGRAPLLYVDPDFAALARDIKEGRRAILAAHPKGKVINAVGLSTKSSASPEERLAHILQGIEVQALRAVQTEHPNEIVLLMHDGFVSSIRLDKARLEDVMRDATGYDLSLPEKRITN